MAMAMASTSKALQRMNQQQKRARINSKVIEHAAVDISESDTEDEGLNETEVMGDNHRATNLMDENDTEDMFGGCADWDNGQRDEEDEEEDENTSGFIDPNETRRILNEMIDTCQELDEKHGLQENEDELIREQVKQSKLMFETQFTNAPTGDSNNRSNVSEKSRRKSRRRNSAESCISLSQAQETMAVADARPTDLYLSYKHTKICAGLMRKRVQTIGSEESILTVEGYLNGLKELATSKAIDDEGAINEGVVDSEVMKLTVKAWKTAPSLPIIVGSFDYKEFIARLEEPQVKKEKTPRRERRKFDPDSLIATQEEINMSQVASQANRKKLNEATNQFRRDLKEYCKGPSSSLFGFALNKQSIRETLNNTFGVAFGIRDGTVALSNGEKNALQITPCTPAADSQHNMTTRRQCILSISAGAIRKLQAAAQGENAVKEAPNAFFDPK